MVYVTEVCIYALSTRDDDPAEWRWSVNLSGRSTQTYGGYREDIPGETKYGDAGSITEHQIAKYISQAQYIRPGFSVHMWEYDRISDDDMGTIQFNDNTLEADGLWHSGQLSNGKGDVAKVYYRLTQHNKN